MTEETDREDCVDKAKKCKSNESPIHQQDSDEILNNGELLLQLSKDIQGIQEKMEVRYDDMNARLENVEKRLTDKVTDKLTKMFDKCISSETSRIKNDPESRIGDVKKELSTDIAE
ncbi:hypothetical protein DPMN_082034 [Dreissena polymorpha]|uniref:Uncharacterized protein n=1 Tax=Dreissena polymorpha TaxID=45954 RepID=A0A9D3YA52_DREPO|nr:hypothetical protein DPMN_082034 [Dreissena polymorpha]